VTTDLIEQARARRFYHVLDLPGYTTTGVFDMRQYVPLYQLPDDLTGKRCLDVGTWDGFWAFEMEKRGASEVIGLDLDDERELDWPARRRPATYPEEPRGQGFRLARELLDSNVERVVKSIYHATPEELGQFDFVLCGSVLIHLRDQMLALERIANLTKPGGLFISAEEYEPITDLVPYPHARYRADRDKAVVFWIPNRRCWRRMLWQSGFDDIREVKRFSMHSEEGYSVRHVIHHAHKHA
jgi:tRNA (mo5U34)-methyltransferase